MVDFNGFDKGVIGRKLPSDSTLNQMKKSELIELLHLAESNHRVLAEAYKIAVDTSKCKSCPLTLDEKDRRQVRADAIKEYKQSEEYIKECVQRYLKGRADIQSELMTEVAMLNETKMTEGDLKCFAYRIKAIAEKKTCSNGQPCTHPNCKRCGTTHFMSECDYGKEQKNGKEE